MGAGIIGKSLGWIMGLGVGNVLEASYRHASRGLLMESDMGAVVGRVVVPHRGHAYAYCSGCRSAQGRHTRPEAEA